MEPELKKNHVHSDKIHVWLRAEAEEADRLLEDLVLELGKSF